MKTTTSEASISTIDGSTVTIEQVENFESDKKKILGERDTWGRSLEFLMSCLSLSVGLGNLWRFPYVCFKHGGSTFLIPYVIVLFFVGKPFYFLEMIIGQFTSKGSIKAMEILPIMKGIGWGQQIASSIIVTYYTAIIGLTLSYFFRSFAAEIPWNTCRESYGPYCIDSISNINQSGNSNISTSVKFYLSKIVLDQKSDVSDGIGSLVWPLVVTLLISWFCVYIAIVKGIKTSGKFAYVFAILPYATLILLLSYACTLNGSIDGLIYLFKPRWGALFTKDIWYDACTQCFYSLTVGMGCIITFSSYNKFTHNIYRDATIISTMDAFTSMLGAATIFAILGNLKYNYGNSVEFETIANSSTIDLVFVTYPDAISKISASLGDSAWYIPQILAVVFFLMLFVLGVGSSVGLLSNLVTNIKDFFPKAKYWQFAGVSCSIGFFIGLLYVTQGGISIISTVDFFAGTFLLFTLATLEIIGIIWLYGLQNICWDVEFMLNIKVSPYWRICWAIIIPVFMIVLWATSIYNFEGNEGRPLYAIIGGWIIFIIGFSQLFFCIAYLYRIKSEEAKNSFLKYLFTPNKKWSPRNSSNNEKWMAFRESKEKIRNEIDSKEGHSWYHQKLNVIFGKY